MDGRKIKLLLTSLCISAFPDGAHFFWVPIILLICLTGTRVPNQVLIFQGLGAAVKLLLSSSLLGRLSCQSLHHLLILRFLSLILLVQQPD